MTASFSVFVYYKVGPAHIDKACRQSMELMKQMTRLTGATTRLMRRADEKPKTTVTLMEVYDFIKGDPLEAQKQLDAIVLNVLGDSPEYERHSEVFVSQNGV